MVVVLIIPTGIGAEIGGHAGDANPVAKLLAGCCDTLITHPNVLNASDINEMTANTLYVEGSALDRFLEGDIGLRRVHKNRILVVANAPVTDVTRNAVNAARVTIGVDVALLELKTPLRLDGYIREDGSAWGNVVGWKQLVDQVGGHDFDALAIHTPIDVDRDVALTYYRQGGVNPWGKVEAMASRLISTSLDKPVAHAPLENIRYDDRELYAIFEQETVDPRIAPEAISNCYLHSVLKGLHQSPRIVMQAPALRRHEVDALVSPWGCYGRPHKACHKAGIPIIMVQENRTVCETNWPDPAICAANYWEAAGILMAWRSGVDHRSVRRPLLPLEGLA